LLSSYETLPVQKLHYIWRHKGFLGFYTFYAIEDNQMRLQVLSLVLFSDVTTHAPANTVQIRLGGETIVLPFDQPVSAWTKTWGMGFHNADIPASQGYALAWFFKRVAVAVTFTGHPLIATEVDIQANNGKPRLTLAEASQIAQTLGLGVQHSDPNMDGDPIWIGDHLSLRYFGDATQNIGSAEIWSDQFPDPSGTIPEE
jgi:hypothetical protein